MEGWRCSACGGENPAGTRFCGQCGAPAEADVSDALRSFVAGPVADRLTETGGRLAEERRLITALFADVSGFTRLASRLDPEQLIEVIDPVISALTNVVARYEGYVEKFAGDALLALFGAPKAHDDDAERALRVALEMREELARLNRELPGAEELTVHLGVNTGHGIARVIGSEARLDYAVLGEAVILAQRLESATPSGEIYVGETTWRLTRERFELEPVGELELKGKSEPVPAWRLIGERVAPPARGKLVGRERELAELRTAVAGGGVVALLGEPGVGKSRLAEAIAGPDWLHARCLSYGAALAYWPYAELVRDERASPFFSRLRGLPAPEIDALEPEAFRRGLHEAFATWLAGRTLAIEDVHWLDASSAELTRELARRGETSLFLTGRPEAEELLGELSARVTRLGPLDEAAVERLVESELGEAPAPGFAAGIAARTGGNPFFVREVVRSLRERGTLDAEVPPTVEGVLSARIDLLAHAASATLQTASVIGRRVRPDLLAAVGGDVETADELVERGFFDRDDGTLVFHHVLVQEVAYSRLLRRQRRELHRRVAEKAEGLYGAGDDVIDLLARHHYLGETGERAAEYLVRAGERAKRLFANEEAILHLERAAEVSGREPQILLELADLHELTGSYVEALRLYTEVRNATQAIDAWRGLAATYRKRGEYTEALATIDEAFSTRGLQGSDLTPLWLEGGWSLSAAGRLSQAVDVLNAGLELAERRDPTVGHVLLRLARAEMVEGELDTALGHGLQARVIFEEHGDLRGLASALRIVGGIQSRLGDYAEAAGSLQEGVRLAERIGSVEEIGGCLINLGLVELKRGELDAAIACDRRAILEFERIGHASGRATAYVNLAEKLLKAGEYDEAREYAERGLELARAVGHSLMIAGAIHMLAAVALGKGEFADAAIRAEEAASLHLEFGAAPHAAESLDLAAEAWQEAGEPERAREAAARARSLTRS